MEAPPDIINEMDFLKFVAGMLSENIATSEDIMDFYEEFNGVPYSYTFGSTPLETLLGNRPGIRKNGCYWTTNNFMFSKHITILEHNNRKIYGPTYDRDMAV